VNGTWLRPVPRLRARLVGTMVGTIALLGALACGGKTPIRIGLMSSFDDPLGRPLRFGAQLAVQEINAKGGVDGRLLELVEQNDGGNADTAVKAATALVESDAVAVIGGAFSGPTLAAAAVLNDAEHPVLQITPSGTLPAISDAGPWTFRACPSDLAHASALARYVRQGLRLERAAVLYMNNNYGRGFRTAFEEEFRHLGGTVVTADPYLSARVADAAPYLDRIAQERRAQIIVAASYETDGTTLLRMARARGIDIPFAGGDGLEGIEREGSVGEGTYQTAAYLANLTSAANVEFVAKYRRQFADQPPPNNTAVVTYDAVHLLARLMDEVGTDRKALRDALAQVGRGRPAYDGVSGRIAFDSLGDVPEKRVLIAQARSGVARAVEGAQ
jgi:branched-chain amino acid transport system substrate-binding protein